MLENSRVRRRLYGRSMGANGIRKYRGWPKGRRARPCQSPCNLLIAFPSNGVNGQAHSHRRRTSREDLCNHRHWWVVDAARGHGTGFSPNRGRWAYGEPSGPDLSGNSGWLNDGGQIGAAPARAGRDRSGRIAVLERRQFERTGKDQAQQGPEPRLSGHLSAAARCPGQPEPEQSDRPMAGKPGTADRGRRARRLTHSRRGGATAGTAGLHYPAGETCKSGRELHARREAPCLAQGRCRLASDLPRAA